MSFERGQNSFVVIIISPDRKRWKWFTLVHRAENNMKEGFCNKKIKKKFY